MSHIHFVLVTTEKILYESDVSFVQAPAEDGYVGFLVNHAPFVSTAGTGVLTCKNKDGNDMVFAVSGGFFEIHLNQMSFLADVAEFPEDIDIGRADRARARALRRMSGEEKGEWDIKRAKASLLRALNRIRAYEHHDRRV